MDKIRIIDACGLSCPQPALLTQQALHSPAGGAVKVLVDSATARDNVARVAQKAGWQVIIEKQAGGGYEIPIHGRIRLVPMVEWAAGRLGGGSTDTLAPQTGLHYSVVEFKLTVVGSFGHRGR